MQLQPKHPPGRKRSKVRAFAAEIHRLHADGYTCDEIRDVLAEAGVTVSRSTVQREAVRSLQRSAGARTRDATASSTTTLAEAPTGGVPVSPSHKPLPSPADCVADSQASDPRTARQIAEDFMKNQLSNPLLHTERKP
jgi:hypothetical protein